MRIVLHIVAYLIMSICLSLMDSLATRASF